MTNGSEGGKKDAQMDIRELLDMCQEKRMWGSVRIIYQDGKIAYAEVTQTVKGTPQAIMVALPTQR